MKQRMYNTFYRKLNNKFCARVLTNVGYAILTAYYYIVSIVVKNNKRNIIDITGENVLRAREMISDMRKKPNMESNPINHYADESVQLSIIIPAYNVENYIEECLLSVLKQKTRYSYEVIVINDGSTDETEKKIKQFKSEKIIYIKQTNNGVSSARNRGLDLARGKYVLFVDSDDVICDGAVEIMMKTILENDADVVVGSFYMFSTESKTRQDCVLKKEIIDNDVKRAVRNPGYPWGKIFKRSLFEKIRFPVGAWYEDTLISSIIYRMCKKMVVLDNIVCGYRINLNGTSQTSRLSPKSLDHYWVMEDIIEKTKENHLENDDIFYEIVFNHMSTFLYRRLSLMDDEVMQSAFVLACDMLNGIRPQGYLVEGNKMKKDLEQAFRTGNYKLWKLAAFLI